jgi:uncharacterized membrane protein
VILLSIGLILFLFPHLWREVGLRPALLRALPSEAAYKALFSLVTFLGLGLIIWGMTVAPFTMVWQPLFELRWVSHFIMLPALILVAAGNLPMSHLRMLLRHPMLLGVLLWSLAHLWANGDLASLLLFASFALWSMVKIFTLRHQARQPRKPSIVWDLIALVTGVVLYLLIFIFHGQLFGVGLTLV